jgi:endonuclease/exonuclease/phosphatase family metal-dependent hydrolase
MRIFAFVSFIMFQLFGFSQIDPSNFERDENTLRVVFYNVENIFDPVDDPNKRDEEFTPDGDRHWDNYKFYDKLKRTSKAIMACGGFTPPEVVGLCEIENRRVLEQLIYSTPLKNANYKISHFESKDRRGIDVGLLYNSETFSLVSEQIIPIVFPWDTSYHTRDILWTQLAFENDTINFFVNHWPSRWGGQLETEPARVFVAQTLKKVCDSLYLKNPYVKLVIMGDFNDSPENQSMREFLTSPVNNQIYLRNLMAEKLNFPGSHKYQGDWAYLDQIILSKGIINSKKGYQYTANSVTPCALPFLLEDDKKHYGVQPFRTFVGFSYVGGFSDHLPVKIDLHLVD